jgi:ferritin-like metal-binding protein YciE
VGGKVPLPGVASGLVSSGRSCGPAGGMVSGSPFWRSCRGFEGCLAMSGQVGAAAKVPGARQEPGATAMIVLPLLIRETMMASKEKTMDDLFLETLKDMYSAEKQLVRALGKMSKAADSEELKQAFEKHRAETEGHVGRIEQVFEILEKPARAKTCHAIQGLVEEANEVAQEFKGTQALDAGLLASAQAVEHYEISRYGTLKSWATELGMDDAADLLDQTLQEEKSTDQLLTRLAEQRINQEAA